jgi:hypothetical protein
MMMAWVALLAMALWVLLVLLRLLCRHLWARRVQVGVVAWTVAKGPCLLWLQCHLFWAEHFNHHAHASGLHLCFLREDDGRP